MGSLCSRRRGVSAKEPVELRSMNPVFGPLHSLGSDSGHLFARRGRGVPRHQSGTLPANIEPLAGWAYAFNSSLSCALKEHIGEGTFRVRRRKDSSGFPDCVLSEHRFPSLLPRALRGSFFRCFCVLMLVSLAASCLCQGWVSRGLPTSIFPHRGFLADHAGRCGRGE